MIKTCIDRVVVPLLFLAVVTTVSLCVVRSSETTDERVAEKHTVGVVDYQISSYDTLFQTLGVEHGLDWILLASIARAESEFRPDAVSRSGAVGLMQVMPFVASSMGVSREELFEPATNIRVAAELLCSISEMYRFGEGINESERLKFILAAYNAGYSRIGDARRLARHFDDDSNRWSVVASYLALLCEEEYFSHEVVKYGAFYGSEETIAYVDKVMHIYKLYKSRIIVL